MLWTLPPLFSVLHFLLFRVVHFFLVLMVF
jgi:hypothetical protein